MTYLAIIDCKQTYHGATMRHFNAQVILYGVILVGIVYFPVIRETLSGLVADLDSITFR